MTRAANLAEAAGSGFAFRRKNLNGAMDIWQRGTSFTTGGLYCADRWHFQRYASSNVAVSQQASGRSDFPNCLRIGRTNGDTGGNAYWLTQTEEATESRAFRGNKATLSFYARAGSGYQGLAISGAAGITASISYHTGSVEEYMPYNNFQTQTTTIFNSNQTLTTSWQYFSVTTTDVLPSTLYQIGIGFGASSSPGTAGANDYFEITGVQLEVGTAATPFEVRPYGVELGMCMRYYEQSPNLTTYVNGTTRIAFATNFLLGTQWIVPKRAPPSVVLYSRIGTANKVSYIPNGADAGSTVTPNNTSIVGFHIAVDTGALFTVGGGYEYNYIANAEL